MPLLQLLLFVATPYPTKWGLFGTVMLVVGITIWLEKNPEMYVGYRTMGLPLGSQLLLVLTRLIKYTRITLVLRIFTTLTFNEFSFFFKCLSTNCAFKRPP